MAFGSFQISYGYALVALIDFELVRSQSSI